MQASWPSEPWVSFWTWVLYPWWCLQTFLVLTGPYKENFVWFFPSRKKFLLHCLSSVANLIGHHGLDLNWVLIRVRGLCREAVQRSLWLGGFPPSLWEFRDRKKAAQRTWPEDSCQEAQNWVLGQARVCGVLDKCDVAFMGELGKLFFWTISTLKRHITFDFS